MCNNSSFLLSCFLIIFSFKCFALEPLRAQGFSTDERFPSLLLHKVIKRGGQYELIFPDDDRGVLTSEVKLHSEILNGDIDLIWTLTSKGHEEKFKAIYIPVYRGMLGMRIGIVRRDQRNIFKNVRSLSDLQNFRAGQGTMWADTAILEANQLSVIKEMKYKNLFPMLEGGRFDYFPRGIPEPWSEVERESHLNLTVEPNILIKYIAPFYYFANPSNKKLINHLTAELEGMIEDRSFQQLFLSHPDIQDAIKKANLSKRVVIELNNPGLTKNTPLDRKELWFDPSQM